MSYFLSTRNNRSLSPLWDLRREMDKLFDDAWGLTQTSNNSDAVEYDWNPVCDVEEGEDHYLMTVEMPGIPKDQIKIECIDNQLTISGERGRESRNTQKEKEKEGYRYTERRYGKFYRSFTLPVGVNADKVEANYEDGVLRLYVPKAESAKPRQIKIGSGNGPGLFGKLLGQTTPSDRREKETHSVHNSGDPKSDRVA